MVAFQTDLHGLPVANLAELKALPALDDEYRLVLDTNLTYFFKIDARVSDADRANVLNVEDDAKKGLWVLETIAGAEGNFDFQIGNIVHAIPNNANSIYEINGQTVKDAKLASYILDHPISGFSVSGENIHLPDWRGRYLGGASGKGLSSTAGTTVSSTNKSHNHDIWTDYRDSGSSSQTGMIIGQANSNTRNTRRGTSKTLYKGNSYARPETAVMPICIIGGRQLSMVKLNMLEVAEKWNISGLSNSGLTPTFGTLSTKHPILSTPIKAIDITVGDRRSDYSNRIGILTYTLTEIIGTAKNNDGWRDISKTITMPDNAEYPIKFSVRYRDLDKHLGFVITDKHANQSDTFGEILKVEAIY